MKYAGFWLRLWATLIDGLLFAIPTILLTKFLFASSTLGQAWAFGIEYVLACAYQVYFQASSGRTLGKFVTKIRVVAIDGAAAGFNKSLLRNIGAIWISIVSGVVKITALVSVPSVFYAGLSSHE